MHFQCMCVCVCQLLSACTGEERERDKGRTVGAYALLVYKSSITSGCGLSARALNKFPQSSPDWNVSCLCVCVCVCVEYNMKLMFVQLAGPRRECTHSCAINLIYVSLSSRGSLRF